MTWIPRVPIDPHTLPDEFGDRVRRLQQISGPVTLEGCTDAQLEAERQRRIERRERAVQEAIKLVVEAGYKVVKVDPPEDERAG